MLRPLPATTIPALESIIAHLARVPGLIAAILFGSAVNERLRPHSDLDMAVYDYPFAQPILKAILTNHLHDLKDFSAEILALLPTSP